MGFKFEKLDVWQAALDYLDLVYQIAEQLPAKEEYNLKSQMIRAATSITLNIAEGSTGQTDAEQARFLGIAIRSLIETVACQHIIHRRNYLSQPDLLRQAYKDAQLLSARLHSMRKAIAPDQPWIRELSDEYIVNGSTTELPADEL